MPKQRRAAASRSPARPVAKKSGSSKAKGAKGPELSKGARASKPSPKANIGKAPVSRAAAKPPAAGRGAVSVRGAGPAARPSRQETRRPPTPPPRRPAFYEALALYETGVRALQRHDSQAPPIASAASSSAIQASVSCRTGAALPAGLRAGDRPAAVRRHRPRPRSVYAATVALNAGDVEGALGHLGRALERAPDSDHAHYIMAVALVDKGDPSLALVHLRQAITLNPDNRSVALQDPDLERAPRARCVPCGA